MHRTLLKQKNSYFAALSDEAQLHFVQRSLLFLEEVNIVGREGMVVTDETRLLIAASAVQLTFGLKKSEIPTLHTINVFPASFYSDLYKTNFKGLTTQGGIVSISWNDFREGYVNERDRLNLGLHELAHALHISLEDGSFDPDFSDKFEEWKEHAFYFFQELKNGENNFLRKYGAGNMHEFFAVTVEHFFELPHEFQKKMPQLYGRTAFLLNQDPAQKDKDYDFDPTAYAQTLAEDPKEYVQKSAGLATVNKSGNSSKRPVRETVIQEEESRPIFQFIRKNGVNVAMAATFTGLFLCMPLLIYFSSAMLVPTEIILLMIFVSGILGLIQWRLVRDHIDMVYHQFAMYAFSGFGMWLTTFLLFANRVTTISAHQNTYSFNTVYVNDRDNTAYVNGDEFHPLAKNLSTFLSGEDLHFEHRPKTITIDFATGILGFDRITGVEFH